MRIQATLYKPLLIWVALRVLVEFVLRKIQTYEMPSATPHTILIHILQWKVDFSEELPPKI
jgi:hypothetical protein